ncbi:unnamed protein product [Adineta steineri]|uniref:Uncharacterized protein n=1 Tax=Adineta steineri TaxID=433720 RepID=A0A814ADN3_9BILA|nr:unnamed protein product [Adineta steineri]
MNYMRHPFHSKTTVPANSRESSNVSTTKTTPTSSSINNSVRFNDLTSTSQICNDREKYLTAKYPPQQMQLIRKRLKVEFWLDDQLQYLYDITDDNIQQNHDHCPGDLIDCLLDIDNESERRTFLLEKLRNVKQSRSITMKFIDDLLLRVKTL